MPASTQPNDDMDEAALLRAASRRATILLRWVARALRRGAFPPRSALARRTFHVRSVATLAGDAVDAFQRKAEVLLRSTPAAVRVLSRDVVECRRLARSALHDAFVASRWLPKVRRRAWTPVCAMHDAVTRLL
jgi:hypothetical protein